MYGDDGSSYSVEYSDTITIKEGVLLTISDYNTYTSVTLNNNSYPTVDLPSFSLYVSSYHEGVWSFRSGSLITFEVVVDKITGDKGDKGDWHPDGTRGPTGSHGPTGTRGSSAYGENGSKGLVGDDGSIEWRI